MSAQERRFGKGKARLVPTVGAYSIIALISILTIGLVVSRSLTDIVTMATDTREEVLPSIIDRQRTAVNLERLGRFAEIIYRSDNPDIRRKYKLASRILSQDSVFEENGSVNKQVEDSYYDIEKIAQLRNKQYDLRNKSDDLLLTFIPGEQSAQALSNLTHGEKLLELLFLADKADSQIVLVDIESRFIRLTHQLKNLSPSIANAIRDGRTFFTQRVNSMRMGLECTARWQRVNESLKQLSENMSTNSASVAGERFTTIAKEAEHALRNGVFAAAALMLALIVLLYFAHRDIVLPIIQYVRGLDLLARGERDMKFPKARLKELNDIRGAVERSSQLMSQLATRTDELEKANNSLEFEIEIRRKAQKELALSKDRAETADKAKSDFLAGMSHEIRTPMNTMLGMGDLILETNPTATQRKYIEIFKSSGEMLLGIINDVLDLSKVEAGQVELESVPIDRDDFLTRTRELVMDRAAQKGVDFIIDLGDGVPAHFSGDPARLRQVLVNLIDNGVKFTEQGEVRLSVERADKEIPGRLTFAVIDTGIGIPHGAQDRIFNRFTQADTSTTRKYGGTGLGLAICQRLVELMGGAIQLESTPGQGSAFHFTVEFPVIQKREGNTVAQADQVNQSEAILSGTSYSILVAEDSDSNQALIELYFKETACKLDFAADGQEALDMYIKGTYDLVLMDIQMPVMDGYESTRKIREYELENEKPARPIVAVTANAFKEDQEKSMAAGCSDYLAKPVAKKALLQCVANHVAAKS